MSLSDLWKSLVKPQAARLTYVRIPESNVIGEQLDRAPLTAESGYFQVYAYSIHLNHEREYLSRYIPTVASIVTETSGEKSREHVRVAGPGDLQRLDASAMGRTVVVNRPLSPQLPFRGGTVSVVAGLIAYKVKDNLPALIDVVSSVTKLAGGPAAAGTVEAVGAVAKGVSSLLGLGEKDLIVSIDHTWSGSDGGEESDSVVLREGYWALLNEPAGTQRSLWIRDGQLMEGPVSTSLKPVTGLDYLVLRLSTSDARDDWQEFCAEEIKKRDEAYFIQNDVEEADRLNKLAMTKIMYSSYFTAKDKKNRLSELRAYREDSRATETWPSILPGEALPLPVRDAQEWPGPIQVDAGLEEFQSYVWS